MAVLGWGLTACAPGKTAAPGPKPNAGIGDTRRSAAPDVAPTASATTSEDAWLSTCAKVSSCGACLNAPPCAWCEGESSCVGPQTRCGQFRVSESQACLTAPLQLARSNHPDLARQLGVYSDVREAKAQELATFRQERFFINPGDCFAVLSESSGSDPSFLHYAIQERGTPDPARKKPRPEPGSGARGKRAELSPEFCPWEPVYLVVSWLIPTQKSPGTLRLQLLRRAHPDPVRLARQTPPAPPASRSFQGGSCTDSECREDCDGELRACNLDCFRYGRHEMGSDRLCKAGCIQAQRSCERSCRVACP